MRRLFLISAVIAAASFIMAAITGGIWGYDDSENYGYYDPPGYFSQEGSIFNENVDCDKEWHINNEFARIEVDSAAVKTLIVPTSENEMIRVYAKVPEGKSITVSANWEDGKLWISAHPKTVTFDDVMENGVVDWLDDIFGDKSGVVVTIEIPERILEKFTLKQGSGTTIIRDINAVNNDFEIGSGTVNFYGSGNYAQDSFDFTLGSGKAFFTDMLANDYDIDIGSGKFVISGLKGTGEIDFGSGKGSIFYSEYDHKDGSDSTHIDMGSGSLDLYLPETESACIQTDIGSGSINVNASGVQKKITSNDDAVVCIGNDTYLNYMYIDMGSGSMNILNTDEEKLKALVAELAVEVPAIPPKSDDNDTVSSSVVSSSSPESTETTESTESTEQSGESEGVSSEPTDAGITTPPEAPNPPEVPDAPNPPQIAA